MYSNLQGIKDIGNESDNAKGRPIYFGLNENSESGYNSNHVDYLYK